MFDEHETYTSSILKLSFIIGMFIIGINTGMVFQEARDLKKIEISESVQIKGETWVISDNILLRNDLEKKKLANFLNELDTEEINTMRIIDSSSVYRCSCVIYKKSKK